MWSGAALARWLLSLATNTGTERYQVYTRTILSAKDREEIMEIKEIIKARAELQTMLAKGLRDWEIKYGMEIKKVIFRGWNAGNVVGQTIGRSASCRVVAALPDEPICKRKYQIMSPGECTMVDDEDDKEKEELPNG
jgi:hypothetical protein